MKISAFTLGTAALVPVAIVAHAEVYLTDIQAAQAIFPGAALEARDVHVSDRTLKAFVTPSKDVVLVDRVLGKHEQITFAVGIAAGGTVRGVEILEYRETYGGQVRNADWRKQFTGKTSASELKVGSDIKNISGATLSSVHVTAGVRRLVHTYDAIKAGL